MPLVEYPAEDPIDDVKDIELLPKDVDAEMEVDDEGFAGEAVTLTIRRLHKMSN